MNKPSSLIGRRFLTHSLPIVMLLWLMFGIRAHNLTIQDPYIDEAFHSVRAAQVWDFEQHPARFGHGKLLVYFWLGLFEAAPEKFILTGRMSIALWSLLSGAGIYAIGRKMVSHEVGLLALGLYAVLPFAVYFERMSMADPFASGFAVLLVWRSFYFAKHPRILESIIIGVLIGLASLAKLTMGLMPLIPVLWALLTWDWRENLWHQSKAWFMRYASPLMLAALVVILMWLPILMPAYLAQDSDQPFVVVNSFNVSKDEGSRPDLYLERIQYEIYDFTTQALLVGVGLGTLALLISCRQNIMIRRHVFFLAMWGVLLMLLPIFGARLVSSRYFMPLSAPIVLLTAYVVIQLAALRFKSWQLLRFGMILGLLIWLFGFAIPFISQNWQNPRELDFERANYIEYQAGILIAEGSIREAADYINKFDRNRYDTIYITWSACHMMYFYLDPAIEQTCLSLDTPVGDTRRLSRQLEADEAALIVISNYREPFFQRIDHLDWDEQLTSINRNSTPGRTIDIWRIYLKDD